jgi:hypothetical protein
MLLHHMRVWVVSGHWTRWQWTGVALLGRDEKKSRRHQRGFNVNIR